MDASFRLSVAPMMERTDRHFRYLMRLVSPNARLYTEMITSAALLHGDADSLLAYDASEHPVAVQLGGNEPEALARATKLVADAGYDEVNLNVGCPSSRVQAGAFGASLMLDPDRVADCVVAMREASSLPVTVKTRIGVDEQDDYEVLRGLTERIVNAGVSALIVHARKAWLSGLSPKENREIPPLNYPRVYQLKREFSDLPIAINGGFTTEQAVLAQFEHVDGVMLGRAAYHEPLLVGRLDSKLFPSDDASAIAADPASIFMRYAAYVRQEMANGTPARAMVRHLAGLFRHRPGARRWRQRLAALASDECDIDDLMAELTSQQARTLYNAATASDLT